MAKWFGKIGYVEMKEVQPGVWDGEVTEKSYYGDVIRNTRSFQQNPNGTNGDVNIGNQISIIADPYANQNIHAMRYIEFMGSNWTISNVDVQYPRLILTIGGLFTDGQ